MRYGFPVSNALLHALIGVIPLGFTALLALAIYARKGNHPATYQLSERWTYGPILWAATDESVPGGHGGHGDAAHNVGGGASGRW